MHRTIGLGATTLALLTLGTALSFTTYAQTSHATQRLISYDLPTSHQVRMKLAAGEYTVQGSPDKQIHVFWSSRNPKESADNLKVSFTNNRGAAEIKTKNAKAMKVIVEVPNPSDLKIRLAFGELRMESVEGNKDISMSAGEILVRVDDPNQYGHVSSSVRVGDIDAAAFQGQKSGFWRHFEFKGQGQYSLHTTLGVGDVVLSEKATNSN